jgi:hypothetical protein
MSGQLDIVVERPFAPSFCFPGLSQRTYLADNVAAVIEVKSDLSSQWGEIESKVQQIRRSDYRPVHTGIIQGSRLSSIPVFAVGYRGYKTVGGLRNRWNATPDNGKPTGVLVIETGCFIFHEGAASDEGASQCATSGVQGIFAFTAMLNKLIMKVMLNFPDMMRYCSIAKDERGTTKV